MHAVKPVTIELLGSARELRATMGARKLILDSCGTDFFAGLLDGKFIPNVLWAMLHDENGEPPADLTVQKIAFNLPVDGSDEWQAAILAAFSNGVKEKNEFLAEFKTLKEKRAELLKQTLIGYRSSPSALKSSDSPSWSSGGDISTAKSPPASKPTMSSAKANGTAATSTSGRSRRKSSTRDGQPLPNGTSGTGTFSA